MIRRPYLDALWTRAARLATRAGTALDELYLEEARAERQWASTDAPPGALASTDAGMSVQLAREGAIAFGAAAGLAPEDLEALVVETAARLGRPAPARARTRARLGVDSLAAAVPLGA